MSISKNVVSTTCETIVPEFLDFKQVWNVLQFYALSCPLFVYVIYN